MWFDTHCHLDFDCFQCDWPYYREQFRKADVTRFLVPSVGMKNWQQVMSLAAYPDIYAAIGIHPIQVNALYLREGALDKELKSLHVFVAQHHVNITAIGECGLDKRFQACLEKQVELFEAQLQLAKQYDKPVVLHSVQQHHQLLASIKKYGIEKGVVHGFSGNYQQAKAFVDLGMKLGIGGVITRPTAEPTRNAISRLPIEALVLETDAPDMKLYGAEQQINSPHYIPHIFQQIVRIRNVNTSILAEALWHNSNQVFAID